MKIPLSSLDYYFYRRSLYTIQLIFEYQGYLDPQLLRSNLEKVIRIFPVASSQMKIASRHEVILETGYPISVTSRALATEPKLDSGSDVNSFLDPIENREGHSLISFLVTHTPTRSFVGISFSHMLGDGASFFDFLDALSKISQSEDVLKFPVNNRELLQRKNFLMNETLSLFEATGYIRPRPANSGNSSLEVFSVTAQQLRDQRKNCADKGVQVSSNDVLMAELTKRFHTSIVPYENKVIVRCPVDYRSILNLPSGYFGNAVRDAVAEFEVGEVETLAFHEIAIRIRQSIQSVTSENIERSLTNLEKLRMCEGIQVFEDVGCPGLLVSNLSKFPMSKINLGIGAPLGFHHASLNPRLALLLPAQDGVKVVFRRSC